MLLFLKNLLFTVLVPGTVAFVIPWNLVKEQSIYWRPLAWIAVVPLLFGTAIYLRCAWDFASFGRGTPFPLDAPKKLVARGLYRYSRNPMYVGVLTVIAGWAALYRSARVIAYALCVFAAFQLFVRLYEEPHMRRVFGSDYEAYCASVRRWI